ncbi:hypothetical protein ACFE04_019572 [Oxalis oulophora]
MPKKGYSLKKAIRSRRDSALLYHLTVLLKDSAGACHLSDKSKNLPTPASRTGQILEISEASKQDKKSPSVVKTDSVWLVGKAFQPYSFSYLSPDILLSSPVLEVLLALSLASEMG